MLQPLLEEMSNAVVLKVRPLRAPQGSLRGFRMDLYRLVTLECTKMCTISRVMEQGGGPLKLKKV